MIKDQARIKNEAGIKDFKMKQQSRIKQDIKDQRSRIKQEFSIKQYQGSSLEPRIKAQGS